MRDFCFNIPMYDIDVKLVQVEKPDDYEVVKSYLDDFGVDEEMSSPVIDNIIHNYKNGGETFRNLNKCKILVIFYAMENDYERAKVYSHEKRHIEDRLLQWFSVDDIESSALLAGHLGKVFYEFYEIVNGTTQ